MFSRMSLSLNGSAGSAAAAAAAEVIGGGCPPSAFSRTSTLTGQLDSEGGDRQSVSMFEELERTKMGQVGGTATRYPKVTNSFGTCNIVVLFPLLYHALLLCGVTYHSLHDDVFQT